METIVTGTFRRILEKPIVFRRSLIQDGDEVRFPVGQEENLATVVVSKLNGSCIVTVHNDTELAKKINGQYSTTHETTIYKAGLPPIFGDEIKIQRK